MTRSQRPSAMADENVGPEPDCDAATAEVDVRAGPDPDFELPARDAAARFFEPGGDFDGALAPVHRAINIAQAHGLAITSRKRNWGLQESDHHTSQTQAFAADLSNGLQPTLEMDAVATAIAAAMGVSDWHGGHLERRENGMRIALLWQVPGHYNHIHVGARREPE